MGKVAYLTVGVAGAGGLSIGGLIAFKPWPHNNTEVSKVAVSIKERYSIALLDPSKDEAIWTKKYEILKTSSPHNSALRAALEKSKEPNKNEVEAKRLLKEGCKEIYESQVDDSAAFSDFKKICSKNNEDASKTGDWNTDEVTASNNKWDKALEALNKHNGNELDSQLSELKKEIKPAQPTTFDQTLRTKVKNWCSSTRGEMFEGEYSIKFKNQEAFCKIIS
ncbi:hypothetical protein MHC_01610 [Mycoplasma haemocanis str. Illinois]|uniref:Uncharacterized protein n=1 Tax=Mycoplasma haemocanis (strain Illinois) TaxID=1111676 RepID=H6N6B6_MYCHN|nr:hypothetical protein [Mycoplasma haemocanis]AEW45188.1 hypothetical protein MHC_01610 [Mycoplasma haemocanis str. Illinois]